MLSLAGFVQQANTCNLLLTVACWLFAVSAIKGKLIWI
ncbi:hypothetical protein Z949_3324 [Sulfitobacter guttiformis KCTC 32187]|nr:hypothetical protein Z949_3324 [Sulfitobacter guttiformis KCTC 32187]